MIKFKNGQLEVKFMDSTIVVLSKARNVFTLLNSSDVDTLEELEKFIKNNMTYCPEIEQYVLKGDE